MAKKKLTAWFSKGINPVLKGVYNASVCKDPSFYRKWDGKTWFYGARTIDGARQMTMRWPKNTPLCWRGLASDPNGGGK